MKLHLPVLVLAAALASFAVSAQDAGISLDLERMGGAPESRVSRFATDTSEAPPKYVTPTFVDADLAQIARQISTMTDRTFVIDPRVCAQISMAWETPISWRELYESFLSVVRAMGFVVTEEGSVTRILPDENIGADSRACRRYPGN